MIDSHAHLEMDDFDGDRDEVMARARESNVETVLSLAMIDEDSSYVKALDTVQRYELYTAIGCHPHDAKIFNELGGERLLRELVDSPRVLAVGEIGLDYHYNLSPPDVQQDVFRRQIRLAREREVPIIVHQRESEHDLITILDEEHASEVGGVLHSFTADRPTAEAAIDRGFFISFSGILTFKSAESLREVARALPLDRLLVETDSPYLAPVPYRGKRNEPAYVQETASCLAALKHISLEVVERVTTENFLRIFKC